MDYTFPPDVYRLLQERMSAGGYSSTDELLVDALMALKDIESRRDELRGQIQQRMMKAGTALSQPLDRDAFKAAARRRRSEGE